MMVHRFLVLTLIACASLFTVTSTSTAQFGMLTGRIPSQANTIVVLNVDKILSSPLAQKEDWRGKAENAFAAGVSILPPEANQFVMAAQMDFDFMQPFWEVSLARTNYEPSLPKIAARWGGSIDRIANRNVVMLPEDAVVVPFGKSMIGAYRPGNRQNVANWLRSTDTTSEKRLSPYLKEAIAYAEKGGTPIIMAMDLTDIVSESKIKERIEQMQALKGKGVDVDRLAKTMVGIKGLMLGITLKDRINGAIKVDFTEDVTYLKNVAKPILLEALANQSAMIDEFHDWKVKVSGKTIQLSGTLYQSGMRRIMSILDAPDAMQQAAGAQQSAAGSATSPGESDKNSLARLSSQQYFKSVSGLIDDLQEKPNRTKVTSLGQVGLWFGRYAKKIDNLPLLNVDSVLLDYGRYVSQAFRAAETGARNVGAKSRQRQMDAPKQYNSVGRWGGSGYYGGYGYGYGDYGYAYASWEDIRAEGQQKAKIRTSERMKGAAGVRQIMTEVKGATADVRRQMTEKYQAEF